MMDSLWKKREGESKEEQRSYKLEMLLRIQIEEIKINID
jgi:hypothetical protein